MHTFGDRTVEPRMIRGNEAQTDGEVSKENDTSPHPRVVEEENKAGKPWFLAKKRNEPSNTLSACKVPSVFVKLSSPISFGSVDTEDESELELDSPERKASSSTCMVSRRIRWSDESGDNLTRVQVFQNNVQEASLWIVLLLLHPTKKSTFEFIHCEFQTEHRLLVSEVIDQIPSLATCAHFQKKKTRKFRSLIRDAPPHHEFINILAIQDYALRNGEILVAVPKASKPKESLARAHRLLQSDDKFLRKAVKRAHISGRALQTLHSSADWNKVRKTLKLAKKSADGSKVGEKATKETEPCVAEPGTDCICAQGAAVFKNKKIESITEPSATEVEVPSASKVMENAVCIESVDAETTSGVSTSVVDRDCQATFKENGLPESIPRLVPHASDSPSNSAKEQESIDKDGDEDDNRFLSDKVMRKYDKTKAARLSAMAEKKRQSTGQPPTEIKKVTKTIPKEALRAHKKAKAAVVAKSEKKNKRKKRTPNADEQVESDDYKETTVDLQKQTDGISTEETNSIEKGGTSVADEIVCNDETYKTDSYNIDPAIPDLWINIHKEDGKGSFNSTNAMQMRNESECDDGIVLGSDLAEQHVDVDPVNDGAEIPGYERSRIEELVADFEASPDAFEQVHADVWINVFEKQTDETRLKEVASCEEDNSDGSIGNELFLDAMQKPPPSLVEIGEHRDALVAFSQDDLDDVHPLDEMGDCYLMEDIINNDDNESPEDEDSVKEDENTEDIEYDGEEFEDCAVLAGEGKEDIEYGGEDYEDCLVIPKARWFHLDSFDDIPDDLSFPIEI